MVDLEKERLAQKTRDLKLRQILTDTINVKLRYEQIIKNLIENEKLGQ